MQVLENCFDAAAAQVSLGNNFQEFLAEQWVLINFIHAECQVGGSRQNNWFWSISK